MRSFVLVSVLLTVLAHGAFAAAPARPATAPAVTFAKDVAPILFAHCAACHRPGEVAPFPLLAYADARRRAGQIAELTASRGMPPWPADEGHGVFLNARRLTGAQIAALRAWADAGAPEGDPADLPAAPRFPDGWQLGEPDLVLEPDGPVAVPADGPDVYRCFVMPTNFPADRYVAAMEVRPGNRRVVHHAMGYVDTSGDARRLDAADPGPGYTAFGGVGFAPAGTLDGWGPGVAPQRLPDGVGMLVPRGADVVVQVHYHPTGKPEADRTRIGLHLCTAPVDKRLHMAVALNPALRIPAGAVRHEERATLTIPADITLHRVAPHLHLIGTDIAVTARLPDGSARKLAGVPAWDFRWQAVLAFADPVRLPRGTVVEVVAHYDNTAANPANPTRPPREVRWGEGTADEMCVAALFYTTDAERLTAGVSAPAFGAPPGGGGRGGQTAGGPTSAQERMAMQIFDKDADGRLDPAERAAALAFIERARGRLTPADRAGAERFLDKIGGGGRPAPGGPTTRPG